MALRFQHGESLRPAPEWMQHKTGRRLPVRELGERSVSAKTLNPAATGAAASRAYFAPTGMEEGSNVLMTPTLNTMFPAPRAGGARLATAPAARAGAHLPRRVKMMEHKRALLDGPATLGVLLITALLERGAAALAAAPRSGFLAPPDLHARLARACVCAQRHLPALLRAYARPGAGVDAARSAPRAPAAPRLKETGVVPRSSER